MADHTPGPWKAEHRNWRGEPSEHDIYISGNEHECYDEDDDGEVTTCLVCTGIAIVHGNATSEKTTAANARLIVTAPDLLAACRLLLKIVKDERDYFMAHFQEIEWDKAIEKAETAIKAATEKPAP